VTVLTVTIGNAEQPEVLNLCEVLYNKKVVLVLLGLLLVIAPSASQVCKLANLVINFSDRFWQPNGRRRNDLGIGLLNYFLTLIAL
jgi:hypothetical protein